MVVVLDVCRVRNVRKIIGRSVATQSKQRLRIFAGGAEMTKSAGTGSQKHIQSSSLRPHANVWLVKFGRGESQDDPCTSVGWSWGLLCFFPSSLIHWLLWRVPSFLVIFEGERVSFHARHPKTTRCRMTGSPRTTAWRVPQQYDPLDRHSLTRAGRQQGNSREPSCRF